MPQVVPIQNWRQYDTAEYEQKKEKLEADIKTARTKLFETEAKVSESFLNKLRTATVQIGATGIIVAGLSMVAGAQLGPATALSGAFMVAVGWSVLSPAEKEVVKADAELLVLQKEYRELEKHRFDHYHHGHVAHQLEAHSTQSFDGLTPVQKSERMQAMEDRIRSALASWAAGHYHDKQHEDVIKSWLHSFAELPGGKRRLLRMKAWMYIVTSKEQTEALWPADI